ncbi:MAG: FAD-dependent oxidoreductase [Proteobacteria bacterium]|nr:FAD-dependent oxidoreductase [Pseudomonadota bacterium]
MDNPAYDVIVIGAGPAGLTAATEVARAGLKAYCLDKLAPGGVLINLGELHDFDEIWSGPDMASRLTDDAAVAGVEIGFGEVTALSGTGPWTVETAEGDKHTARAVVLATGLDKGRLGLPNEDDYEGRGISHCAHCDAPLYAGLPVIVAGAGGWADYEAKELIGVASEITMVDAAARSALADVNHIQGRIVGLEGSDGLQSVTIETGGQRKNIPASAVFVYLDQRPATGCLPASVARDASGHVVVDAEGRTSIPTLFAAGDVRAGARYYLSDAIADGQRVAKSVVAMLKKSES